MANWASSRKLVEILCGKKIAGERGKCDETVTSLSRNPDSGKSFYCDCGQPRIYCARSDEDFLSENQPNKRFNPQRL
jgi:hypothetical protein